MAKSTEVPTVRLQNINSGAIVSVAEEKADRLGSDWEPVKASTSKKSATSDQK